MGDRRYLEIAPEREVTFDMSNSYVFEAVLHTAVPVSITRFGIGVLGMYSSSMVYVDMHSIMSVILLSCQLVSSTPLCPADHVQVCTASLLTHLPRD